LFGVVCAEQGFPDQVQKRILWGLQAIRPEDAAVFHRLVGIMRDSLASPDIDDLDAPPQRRVLHAVISMQACLLLKVPAWPLRPRLGTARGCAVLDCLVWDYHSPDLLFPPQHG
jgi:hypothetical protein